MIQKNYDIPRKLLLFITYVLTMYIVAILIAIILNIIFLTLYPNNPNNGVFVGTLTNLLCYALMVFVFLFVLEKYFYDEFQNFKKRFLHFVGIAIAGWFLNMFLSMFINVIMQLVDFVPRESQNQQAISETLKYPLLAIPMIVIGAPIVEEVIFRGVIFNFARNLKLPHKLNIVLAFILSSSLFGLIHVFSAYLISGDKTELILGIPYIAAGFALTLVYYFSNNIFVPIITHCIQNTLAVIVMLLLRFMPEQIPVKLVYILKEIIYIF